MPKTIELPESGLAFDFPDNYSDQLVADWLNENVAGREDQIRRSVQKTNLEELNTTTPEYGTGIKLWQAINHVGNSFFQAVASAPESLAIWTDYAMNEVASIAPGITLGGLLTKAAGVNPYEVLADKIKDIRSRVDENTTFVPDEAYNALDRFALKAVPQGVGSALAFMTGGAAFKLAGVGSKAAIASLGAFSSYGDAYRRSQEVGDSKHMSNFIAMMNAGVGLTEAFPLAKFMDRLGGKAGWKFGDTLLEGGEEFAQEAVQTGMADFLAMMGKEDVDLSETLADMVYQGAVGFVTGAGMSAATGGLSAPRRRTEAEKQKQAQEAAAKAEATQARENAIKAENAVQRMETKLGSWANLSDAEKAQAQKDLDEAQGIFEPVAAATRGLGRLMGRAAQIREAGAQVIGRDYGLKQALSAHIKEIGLMSEPSERTDMAIGDRDLDMVTRAMIQSLNPDSGTSRALLAEALAEQQRPVKNFQSAAVIDDGRENSGYNERKAQLLKNYELGEYLKALRAYARAADEAGETRQAERIRKVQAELMGFIYTPDKTITSPAINRQMVRELAFGVRHVQARYDAEAEYPEGSTVEVSAGYEGGPTVKGTIVGYHTTLDEKLGLNVEIPGGHLISIPADRTKLEVKSVEPGTRYVNPLEVSKYEDVKGKRIQEVVSDQEGQTQKQAATGEKPVFKYVTEGQKDPDRWLSSPPPDPSYPFGGAATVATWRTGWKAWESLPNSAISPAAWVNIENSLAEQGVRETALSLPELDIMAWSVGVSPSLSRQEALQKIQAFREALSESKKGFDYLVDQPRAVLESYLGLIGIRTRNQSIVSLAKRVAKEFPKRNEARYAKAREEMFWRTLRELVDSNRPINADVFYSAKLRDDERATKLLNDYLSREEERDKEWVTLEAFQDYPRLTTRPGDYIPLSPGDTVPVRLDGFQAWNGEIVPTYTVMGNWLHTDGKTVWNNGSSGMWTGEMQKAWKVNPIIYKDSTKGNMTYERAVEEAYKQLGTADLMNRGQIVSEITAVPITFAKPRDVLPDPAVFDRVKRLFGSAGIPGVGVYVEEGKLYMTFPELAEPTDEQPKRSVVGPAVSEDDAITQFSKALKERFYTVTNSQKDRADTLINDLRKRKSKAKKENKNAWLGPYTTQSEANLTNDQPVYIKPLYPAGVRKSKTRLGFAEVGYTARDTELLKPDALAEKHNANLKRAQQPTTRAGKRTFREPVVEIFKPQVFVVMYNQMGEPLGHYKFQTISEAKAYLSDKLDAEGVGTQVVKIKAENIKEMPKGYVRLPQAQQDPGSDYIKVRTPTYVATKPKPHNEIEKERREALVAASAAEVEKLGPEGMRLGGMFSLGFEGQIPMVKNMVRVRQRPDWGEFTILGPVSGVPGLVRIRNSNTGEEMDIGSHNLTEATESLPEDIKRISKGTDAQRKWNIRRREAVPEGGLKPLTLQEQAQQIATQVPMSVTLDQMITMSEGELRKLAADEAFSDPVLLGLRIGRQAVRTAVDLDMVQEAARTRNSPVWTAALEAATGAGASQQFDLMASDQTYKPKFAPSQPMPEGFSPVSGRPTRVAIRNAGTGETTPGTAEAIEDETSTIDARPLTAEPGQTSTLAQETAQATPTPGTEGLSAEEQFISDVQAVTSELRNSPYQIKRNMRRMPKVYQRIVQSRIELPIPIQSFESYSLYDIIRLGEQEGDGSILTAAYRVGRNLKSVTQFAELLRIRDQLWNEGTDAMFVEDEQGVSRTALGEWYELNEPSKEKLRDSKMLRKWANKQGMHPAVEKLVMVESFFNPAIEAATGRRIDLSYAESLELWRDPSYKPPLDCASPCVRNPDAQPDDQQNPPKGASTPDPSASQPKEFKPKARRRKKTVSLNRLIADAAFRREYPLVLSKVLPVLEGGTYQPRSWEHMQGAAKAIVDQWDTGFDGLRELAEAAVSIHPADRWWNLTDDLKPHVLVDIVGRLREYNRNTVNGLVKGVIDQLQAQIWHDVQMMGSARGQALNAYKMIVQNFTKEFYVQRVIRSMFVKAQQEDTYNKIEPELLKLKDKMDAAAPGEPKQRVMQQMNDMINANYAHTRADKFWSLWYNNVLSGTRTQFDNMTMVFNLAAESGLHMMMSPKNAHRVVRGVLRGLTFGLSRFTSIFKGQYASRLVNPIELDREMQSGKPPEPDPLMAWRKSKNPILKMLGHTRYVTNFMYAIDNVVSQGAFELRAQTRAYQVAMDNLAKRKKAGEFVVITNKMVADEMDAILKTSPEDIRRYNRQIEQEIADPSSGVTAENAKQRLAELKRMGYPSEILDNPREYALAIAGNREPYGWIGYIHRMISNARTQPNVMGGAARAVFPFTRWAANWTNILMDWMPPTALARLYIHAPSWKWAGGYADNLEFVAKKLLVKGDQKLDPKDYQVLRWKFMMGSAMTMAAYAAFSRDDDDEEPDLMLTGGLYNLTPDKRNLLREKGIAPWSIVIGGKSISYRNTPLAGLLGTVGNVKDVDRFGGTEEESMKWVNAIWRGALLVKDMSVLSGFSELLDVFTDNRLSAEVRSRSVLGWFGRLTSGVLPLSNLAKDMEAWMQNTFDKPAHYTPADNMGMFFRDFPYYIGTSANQDTPTLNVLGEPINVNRTPWSRQIYPRRDDPVWEAIGVKALQGVFIPGIRQATKIDPATGDRVRMDRGELDKYRAEVYRRTGDIMRENYAWWRDAEPEYAQAWLDQQLNYIRRWVRYELNLR